MDYVCSLTEVANFNLCGNSCRRINVLLAELLTACTANHFDALLELMLKARTCNFGLLQVSLMSSQVLFHIKEKEMRVDERQN